VPSPVERTTSPTRLERWAYCPHAHLVQDLLEAGPVENPEDILMITPIDKGNLVHEVLEHFIAAVLARPAADRPGPSTPWTAEDRGVLEQMARAVCDRYEALGLTGRPLYWQRDKRRILDDLDTFLVEDSHHRRTTGTSPLAVELAFGMDGGGAAVGLDLPDGRALLIRGKADRIDLAADGTIHVVDYKTGKADAFKGLSEEEPVLAGTKLQLPVYGLAGRQHDGRLDAPVRAEYWFVTERGDFLRTGYAVTDDVLRKATDTIAAIVQGIEAGVFPARPAAGQSTAIFVDCDVCDPDGLGTVELRQQWERKRDDPALARYAQLAEPLVEDDG
jgi:ATP-dependent helicase/nuclease subunit B